MLERPCLLLRLIDSDNNSRQVNRPILQQTLLNYSNLQSIHSLHQSWVVTAIGVIAARESISAGHFLTTDR